jgi:hypothetical protein
VVTGRMGMSGIQPLRSDPPFPLPSLFQTSVPAKCLFLSKHNCPPTVPQSKSPSS